MVQNVSETSTIEPETFVIFYDLELVQNRLRRFILTYGVQIIDLWKRVENDKKILKFPLFYLAVKVKKCLDYS